MDSAIDAEKKQKQMQRGRTRPTRGQLAWLRRGLAQPGGKLPLFDEFGQKVSDRTVKSCIDQGWAEPWFDNPIKPDWQVCKLTEKGRNFAEKG
jgi:hypothetical protein